jgi:hypothetical protein
MKSFLHLKSIHASLFAAALLAVSMGQSYAAVVIPNTFTAGTPAVATQVNDNFTAVKTAIDALQASKSVTYSIGAFTPAISTLAYTKVIVTNGFLSAGAAGSFVAPLTIPAGSVITGMQARVFDGINPGVVTVSLNQAPPATKTVVSSVSTLATDVAGYYTLVSPVLNYTVPVGPATYNWLQVDVDAASGSLGFYAVTIFYQ